MSCPCIDGEEGRRRVPRASGWSGGAGGRVDVRPLDRVDDIDDREQRIERGIDLAPDAGSRCIDGGSPGAPRRRCRAIRRPRRLPRAPARGFLVRMGGPDQVHRDVRVDVDHDVGSVGKVAALDLVEHLVDVGRRSIPTASIRSVDGRESGGSVRSSARRSTLAEPPADPLGGRQLVFPGKSLDRPQFGVVEQHLESLSHVLSLDDSSRMSQHSAQWCYDAVVFLVFLCHDPGYEQARPHQDGRGGGHPRVLPTACRRPLRPGTPDLRAESDPATSPTQRGRSLRESSSGRASATDPRPASVALAPRGGGAVTWPRTPLGTLEQARTNLGTLTRAHPTGMSARWLQAWRSVLAEGPDTVLQTLTARTPLAIELRRARPSRACCPTTSGDAY